MFMWETGIIILLSLFLMVFLMFNFREFVEDTTAAKLESLFAVERIWVPFGVTAVLFLIGGVLPGRIFQRYRSHRFSGVIQRVRKDGTSVIVYPICRSGFYMWIDVCSDAPVSLCY